MTRYNKNKAKYVINIVKKVKWFNLFVLLLYILTTILLLHDIYYIAFKFASYTWFGLITYTMALIINVETLEYIKERL